MRPWNLVATSPPYPNRGPSEHPFDARCRIAHSFWYKDVFRSLSELDSRGSEMACLPWHTRPLHVAHVSKHSLACDIPMVVHWFAHEVVGGMDMPPFLGGEEGVASSPHLGSMRCAVKSLVQTCKGPRGEGTMERREQEEEWDDHVLRQAYQRALDKYAHPEEATKRKMEEAQRSRDGDGRDEGRRAGGVPTRGKGAREASRETMGAYQDRKSPGEFYGAGGESSDYYRSHMQRASEGVSSPNANYGYYTPPYPPYYPPPAPQYPNPYAMPPAYPHSAHPYATHHGMPSPWHWPPPPPTPQDYPPPYQTLPTPPAPPSDLPVPEGPLEALQDEEISALLMSWYYAGFYTGRASAATERKEPVPDAEEFANLKL